MEGQLKNFPRATVLAAVLETILVIFWQRVYLLSTHVLRICLRLNSKVTDRLVSLVDEISRQAHIDSFTWLLVVTHMQIYNEKEQVEQKEIKCMI
jgi:hypothetical protein